MKIIMKSLISRVAALFAPGGRLAEGRKREALIIPVRSGPTCFTRVMLSPDKPRRGALRARRALGRRPVSHVFYTRGSDGAIWSAPNLSHLCSSIIAATAAVWLASIPALGAGSAASTANIGVVTFTCGHMSATGVGKPTYVTNLTDGFTITSDRYDVSGSTAQVTASPKLIKQIVADGAPVTVVFKNQAEGTRVRFLSDHVEMHPDPTQDQPTQEKVTFTGHVTMYVANYAALQQESKSTMDHAIVYIGAGPDYPKIDADNVNGTAIPAQGK